MVFGYTRPCPDELLVREYEVYRAVYCGLCKVGGARISRLTRFFLNYDFVFLCLVRMVVTNDTKSVEKRRCPYHFKKRNIMSENQSMVYTAAAFALLAYHKALDDLRDSKGIKKLFKYLTLPIFTHMRKRALRLYPSLDACISQPLGEMYALEESGCASIDQVADAFARTLSAVASEGTDGENREILSQCGYHTGRYIYIIDAFEDAASDEESGEYNVLNIFYGDSSRVLAQSQAIQTTIQDSAAAFCRAFQRNGGCFENLIYNIMEQGSATAFRKALAKRKEAENERSV